MVVVENHVIAMEEGSLKNNPKYMRTPSKGEAFLSSVPVWTGWEGGGQRSGLWWIAQCPQPLSAHPQAKICFYLS